MAMNPPSILNSSRRRDLGNPIFQIVLLLIVLVLSSWFVIKPKLSAALQQRKEYKLAEQRVSKTEEDEQELNRLISEMKSSPQENALVDEALPLTDRVSKTYVLLDSLVRFSGMSSNLLSADDSSEVIAAGDKDALNNPYQPGKELHVITMTTSVVGTMDQFRSLLQLIETNGRVLDIESVNIVGGESETKFRIVVKAYSYVNL